MGAVVARPSLNITSPIGRFYVPAEWTPPLPDPIVSDVGTFDLVGIDAGLSVALVLTCTIGTFDESGNDAILIAERVLGASAGTFTETGIDAGLAFGRSLFGTNGTFTETGITTGLAVARVVTAGTGDFAETGTDAVLSHGYNLSAGIGTFTETGNTAGVTIARRLSATVGTFAISGQPAEFGITIHALSASFSLTGFNAALTSSAPKLNATMQSFALTGKPATFFHPRIFPVSSAQLAATGFGSALTWTRRFSVGLFSLSASPIPVKQNRLMVASSRSLTLLGRYASLFKFAPVRREWSDGTSTTFLLSKSGALVSVKLKGSTCVGIRSYR